MGDKYNMKKKPTVFSSNLKMNLKKAIPFTMSFYKRKYLEINLIKNVQDLYRPDIAERD